MSEPTQPLFTQADMIPTHAAEVAALRQQLDEARAQLAVCSCGTSPMTYEGPEADCPVHGAVRAFNEASAELAELRATHEKTLAALAEIKSANDRLLVVYRAAEVAADQILAMVGGAFEDNAWLTDESKAIIRAVRAYRSAAPAEPTPHAYTSTACIHGLHEQCRRVCKYGDEPCLCGCHGGVPVDTEETPACS